MRLINGDALYRKVKRECNPYGKPTIDFESGNRVLDLIDSQPTIQPEPHKGHWEPVGMAEAVGGESAMWGSAIAYHVCSECKEQALEEDGEEKLSDFCPHCGAKMEVNNE